MTSPKAVIFLVLSVAASSIQSVESITYKAAVVEFSTEQFALPTDRIKKNLDGFEQALEVAIHRDKGVQIVVFPEDAILGNGFFSREAIAPYLENIPIIESGGVINPCKDSEVFKDRPILSRLSCLARDYSVVLVANMGDIQNCMGMANCPPDNHFQFNTNVVFEADGTLIAKYHKINLYAGEHKIFDSGSVLNTSYCVSFQTSFGVTFGTFTCYDILFRKPGNCLLDKGIKNFVLPTEWGSSFPYYMSVAVQQSWSRKHGVNILAANMHFNLSYSTGSGLYAAGLAKHYFIYGSYWIPGIGYPIITELHEDPKDEAANETQYAEIAVVGETPSKTNTYLKFSLLNGTEGVVYSTYKNGASVTCTLKYSMESTDEIFALGSYAGPSVDDPNFSYSVCTLVKCPTREKCGKPADYYQSNTVFGEVQLTASFPPTMTSDDVYVNVLGSSLELLEPSLVQTGDFSLSISGYKKPILAANLWTRLY